MKKEYGNVAKQKERLAGIECAYSEINRKNNLILNIQSRWMQLLQDGKSLEFAVRHMGYHRIAVYGYGYLGKALYKELKDSKCQVMYIIDKYFNASAEDKIEIFRPDAELQTVDAVIVTAVYEYEKIKKKYEKNVPYVSLVDVIEFAEKESGSGWTEK